MRWDCSLGDNHHGPGLQEYRDIGALIIFYRSSLGLLRGTRHHPYKMARIDTMHSGLSSAWDHGLLIKRIIICLEHFGSNNCEWYVIKKMGFDAEPLQFPLRRHVRVYKQSRYMHSMLLSA